MGDGHRLGCHEGNQAGRPPGPEGRAVCSGCCEGVWHSWMVVQLALLSFQKGADRNCSSGGPVLSFQLQLGVFKLVFVISKLH